MWAVRSDNSILTARQWCNQMNTKEEVLKLVLDGKSNEDISRHLNITVATVKYHVTGILKTFECKRRTELIVKLQRKGE